MKKLIFVLVAASFGLSSCSKETKLENRLDGKWNIDSYTYTESSVINFYSDDVTVFKDSVRYDLPDARVVETTVGDLDFVSDSKLVLSKVTTTTTTNVNNGVTSIESTTEDDFESNDYFVSAEDEVTLVDAYGDFTVFKVTSNEKDSQTWEYENVTTDTDDSAGGYEVDKTTVKIVYKLSLKK